MDSKKLWQNILNSLKTQTSLPNFRAWLSKTQVLELDLKKKVLVIAVPSVFNKGEIIRRYGKQVEQLLKDKLGGNFKADYVINTSLFSDTHEQDMYQNGDIFELAAPSKKGVDYSLSPKFSLENYVVGLTNNLAYAAAQAVIQNPGTTYNPLFIYGPSGVGKTHLMHAIGNTLLKKNPQFSVVYATSEKFMNDLVSSIQTKRTEQFRQKYRSCDVFLVDDVQFISGKDSTQEEFFHTFNDLQSKNSQIILTSDRPPGEIQKLEIRLSSRFKGGLMVDIQLPDFDTRMAILKAKLKEKGEDLPEEQLRVIAEKVQSNARELEGRLIAVIQMSKVNNKPSSMDDINRVLGSVSRVQKINIDYKKVFNVITGYFGVSLIDLIGPRRQKELVLPRQIAMFLIYENCGIPMEKIGQIIGGRDHTTILHGIDKIKDLQTRDREVQRILVDIKQQVGVIL